MKYNLIEERWIPVLWANGKTERVTIKKALTESNRIRQIAASNPMDRLAVMRFLLAVLYWCKGNPDEGAVSAGEPFPEDWFAKLDEYKEYFNLLGDGKRFYQDETAKRRKTVTELIQEIPTGNNFWHFRHTTDEKEGLCEACCATGLLRLPLFSVSGLPDLKTGINGVPPYYIVPYANTLKSTLCANWISKSNLSDPEWVKTGDRKAFDSEVPLLVGLTLPARKVWLHKPSAPAGMCQCCGEERSALIRSCEFQTAGSQENNKWNDPHVVYLDKVPRKAMKAPDLTASGSFKMDKPWPNLTSRILETGKFQTSGKSITLLIIGFSTHQAKNIDVWERIIELPPKESISERTTLFLSKWHKEGAGLENKAGRSKKVGAATLAAIRPYVEGKVSASTGKLLSGETGAWEAAADEYSHIMNAAAESLSPGFTSESVEFRKKIAGIKPNMALKKETEKKPKRKKGGGE